MEIGLCGNVGFAALALKLSGFQVLAQELSTPAGVLQQHFNLVLLAQLPLGY